MNQLEIILKAQDEASKTINSVKTQVDSMEKSLGSLSAAQTGAAASGLKFGAAAGVAFAAINQILPQIEQMAAAVIDAGKAFATAGSDLVDLKKQLGIGVVEMQKIQFAAKQTGVEMGSLTTSLAMMERVASKSPEKIAQLGISFGQIAASKPEDLLKMISDGLQGVSDQNERARISTEIFGRSGSQMLKMLTDDYSGLLKAAESTGLMTDEMAQKGDRMDDAFARLDSTIENLKNNLVGAFASEGVLSSMEAMASLLGLMARNADKLYEVAKLIDQSGALKLADNVSYAMKLKEQYDFMNYKGGPKFDVPVWEMGKKAPDPGTNFANIFAPADPKEVARAIAATTRETERLAAAEKRLFDQRSAHMGPNPLVGNGGMFGAFWAPGKYDVTGGISMNDPHKVYNMWGDASKFLPTQMDGNIHIGITSADIAQKKAADSARTWALALQGVALMAGAIGGKVGDAAQVMGNIAESFKGWKDMPLNGKIAAVSLAAGQIGGLMGGSGGAFLQGAGGGAAAGASIGGVPGAIVGGLLGGIGGLFGASSKQKAELADAKKQLEALSDTAKRFGIDLTSAFNSKSIKDVQSAIGNVTKAVEDQKKRLEGLSTAAGGFNAFAKGGGITDQASSDRASLYAGAIFAGMVKDTGDVVGALTAIRPALDEMAKKAEEMGLSLGTGVSNLIGMNHVLEGNEGLAQQMSGLNQMMKGLGDAGLMTKDLFQAFGADTAAVFNKLIEGGATGTQALTLMQPTLQQLYEGQKRHGWAIDEATQKLLDEAKAQGVVGDEFMSANEQMVDLLKILIEAVGGTLPDAYKRAGDAAEEYGRRATASLPSPGSIRYNDGTTAQPDGMAFGGIVAPRAWAMPRAARGIVVPNRPGLGTAVVMGEAASAEVAAPVNALFGSLGDMMAAKVSAAVGGNRGGMVHTVINLDGKPFLEVISNALTSGGPAAQGFRDALAGAGR